MGTAEEDLDRHHQRVLFEYEGYHRKLLASTRHPRPDDQSDDGDGRAGRLVDDPA